MLPESLTASNVSAGKNPAVKFLTWFTSWTAGQTDVRTKHLMIRPHRGLSVSFQMFLCLPWPQPNRARTWSSSLSSPLFTSASFHELRQVDRVSKKKILNAIVCVWWGASFVTIQSCL